MPTTGDYFSNFNTDSKKVIPEPEVQEKKSFWDNPGFWSKVGEIGSALVGQKTPLGQAAKYASAYHNAQQLDAAQRRVLQNAAAGVDPMTGMTSADTQGLSPEQIAKLSETGTARQSALVREGREATLAENTLKSGEAYRDYTKKLESQIDQKMSEKRKLDENWELTIQGVKDGTIKSKYITPEMVPILEGLGREQSDTVIKEIMREHAAADARGEKTDIRVDEKRGIVIGANDKGVQWKVQYADPASGTEEKSHHRTRAERAVFQEFLPQIKEAYFKSFGENAATAQEFNNLVRMTSDPLKGGQARDELMSYASPEVRNSMYKRENAIASSLAGGKGLPIEGDPNKAKKLIAEMEKKLGRKPYKSEFTEEYNKRYGGGK